MISETPKFFAYRFREKRGMPCLTLGPPKHIVEFSTAKRNGLAVRKKVIIPGFPPSKAKLL